MEIILKHISFYKSGKLWKLTFLKILDHIWKRRAPGNDANSLNKIWRIMDMRSISTTKHEMEVRQ